MSRALPLVGLIALAFGLGAYYATGAFGAFPAANLALGAFALAASGLRGVLSRLRGTEAPAARGRLRRQMLLVVVALVAAVALERAAAWTGWQADWTAEQRFELAPATVEVLEALPAEVRATLYYDAFDPRVRRTRLLLRTLAQRGPVRVGERQIDEAAVEADRFQVATSNSVVLELGERWETVAKPSEATLYEALRQLVRVDERVVYVPRGEGEGDLSRSDDVGYAGLAAALHGEGYVLRELVTAASSEIPEDADALLLIGPARRLREPALEALRRYLARGGRLVALLDPGRETGVEALLSEWGFALPDGVVIDPASGPVEGDPPGVNPILFHFAEHPVVRGLDSRRMIFLLKARPVRPVRKPETEDVLRGVAFTSSRAWVTPDVPTVEAGLLPPRPPDATEDYQPLVSVGRYPREGHETRIVVFGDSDFASNRYLRALYNMDVIVNAMHWATQREEAITLRPKVLTPNQFPLTPQDSLRMFYGVGLVVPELCLIVAALIWQRRRGA